jgi:hypothetical protein
VPPLWRGYAAILGGFLLQFTMVTNGRMTERFQLGSFQGAFYSFGNMSTYMTSYMRQNDVYSGRNESMQITYTGGDILLCQLCLAFF